MIADSPPVSQYAAAAFAAANTTKWHGEQWPPTNRGRPMIRDWKQARFRGGVFRILLLFAFIGAVIAAAEGA